MTPALPAAPESGPNLTVPILAATAVLSVALLALYGGPLSFGNLMLALLMVNLAMLPAAFYLGPGRRVDFPIFELLLSYYAVSFGWTAFADKLEWRDLTQPQITRAFLVAFDGVLALMVGYYLVRLQMRLPIRGPAFARPLPAHLTFLMGVLMLAANTGLFLIGGRELGGAMEQVRVTVGGFGLALCWLHYFKAEAQPAERLLIVGLTVLMMLIQALVASIKPLIVPLVVIAVSYWRSRHRVPWGMMALVVVVFAVINPVKHYWRDRVWHAGHDVTLMENLGYLADAFEQYYFGDAVIEKDSKTAAINRVSDIAILGRAAYYTPKYIPYWRGVTLKVLVYSMIPRSLMPDKPRSAFGNPFGRIYEIIGPNDYLTLISVNWVTEVYINFGPGGVFLGMMLIGCLTRVIQESASSPGVPDLQFAVGLGAAGPLFNGGENLAMVWGGF
ncbi:MAG TPA: hypothetical protein VHE37_11545, partial [Nevskiaceae bacterium]|nr:hypothetical protein [Nevskiaceae bacterium]